MRGFEKKLKLLFTDGHSYKYGKNWLTLDSFVGKSKHLTIEITDLHIEIHPIRPFRRHKVPLIQIVIGSCNVVCTDINVFKKLTISNIRHQRSIESWIFGQFFQFFFVMLIRSISLFAKSIKVSVPDFVFLLDAVLFKYLRDFQNLNVALNLADFSLIFKENGMLSLPQFGISLQSSTKLLTYLLKYQYRYFKCQVPMVKANFDQTEFNLNSISAKLEVINDDEIQCLIDIDPIKLIIPKHDLHTQSFAISIANIQGRVWHLTTGRIIATRNQTPLGEISQLSMSRKHVHLYGNVSISVATPLIIDFALLKRFFTGTADFPRTGKFNFFRQLIVDTPKLVLTFLLTDNHVYQFNATKVSLQNMVVNLKKFEAHAIFPSFKTKVLCGTKGQINFDRPFFALKADDVDVFFDPQFAESSFLQETFEMFSFIEKQFRGNVNATRDLEPPTRRIISLAAKHAKLTMHDWPLSVKIHHSNEAKRASMQALLLRRAKAIQILEARNSGYFNEEAFEEKSKEMLFKMFREALQEMPPPDDSIYTIAGGDVEAIVNGPGIPNTKTAIEHIVEIVPDVEVEDIGRVTGGLLTLNAGWINWQLPHVGDIARIDNAKLNGVFIIAKRKGVNRNDFYHYKVTCDEGQVEYEIPQIASKGVTFIKATGPIQHTYLKWSTALMEFFQDNKLASYIFVKNKFQCKKLGFVDFIRIRFRCLFDFQIDSMDYGYNDGTRAFAFPDFLLMNFENSHLTFDGRYFHLISNKYFVKVLTDKGFNTLLSFPDCEFYVVLPSVNHLNNGIKRPVFIPIDSSRVTDPTYDPYELFRTSTFGTEVKGRFSDSYGLIDMDCFQPFIDHYFYPRRRDSVFLLPFKFAPRSYPLCLYTYTDVDAIAPKINIIYRQGEFEAKVIGTKESPVHFNGHFAKGDITVDVFSELATIILNIQSQPMLKTAIADFSYKRYKEGHTIISGKEINVDLSVNIIPHISEIDFTLPQKKKQYTAIEDILMHSDLIKKYSSLFFQVNFPLANVRLFFDDPANSFNIILEALNVQINRDENKAGLFIFNLDSMKLMSVYEAPLLEVTSFDMNHAGASNLNIDFISLKKVGINLKPIDVEVISERAAELVARFKKFSIPMIKAPKEEKQPKTNRLSVVVDSVTFKLTRPDGNVIFLNSLLKEIELKMLQQMDGSQRISISLKQAIALNENANDEFRTIFDSSGKSQDGFISVLISKTKNMMKYPVFDQIILKLSPFVVRIPFKFVKDLMVFFPSADDLKILDFDADDDGVTIETEPIEPQIIEDDIQIDQNASENAIFIREFYFYPFKSSLSLRRKVGGKVFNEFLDRPFDYSGLHMFNVFGTKEQLSAFVKRNLKWAVIKALPSFIFKKRSNSTKEPPVEMF